MNLNQFAEAMEANKGLFYRIHTGWNIKDSYEVEGKKETCINSGIIETVEMDEYGLLITLKNGSLEKFSNTVERVEASENEYYVIYKDNSYFRITVQS